MGKKEEITDLVTPEEQKKLGIKVGTVLKFNYEGSPIHIKVTRRAKGRMWGEHVTLGGMDEGMSHYGHELDRDQTPVFCTDCKRPVTQFATKQGELAAWERDPKRMKKLGKGKKR